VLYPVINASSRLAGSWISVGEEELNSWWKTEGSQKRDNFSLVVIAR